MSYPYYDDEPTEELDLRPLDDEPEPPRRHGLRTWLIVGVVGVVLGAAVFVVYKLLTGDNTSKAQPGDCIKVNSATEKSADIEQIACTDSIAVFKVAKKLGDDTDQCPTGSYSKYTQSGRGSDFALCLMLNANEGDCFTSLEQPAKLARVDCTGAEIKITKVLDGQTDEAACDGETAPLVYPEPPTTLCIGKP
jgi:hypothetical protein